MMAPGNPATGHEIAKGYHESKQAKRCSALSWGFGWARQASNLRPADYEFLRLFRCNMLEQHFSRSAGMYHCSS
jgi:hypothetical protein